MPKPYKHCSSSSKLLQQQNIRLRLRVAQLQKLIGSLQASKYKYKSKYQQLRDKMRICQPKQIKQPNSEYYGKKNETITGNYKFQGQSTPKKIKYESRDRLNSNSKDMIKQDQQTDDYDVIDLRMENDRYESIEQVDHNSPIRAYNRSYQQGGSSKRSHSSQDHNSYNRFQYPIALKDIKGQLVMSEQTARTMLQQLQRMCTTLCSFSQKMDCDLSSSKKEIIQLQNGLASKIETNMARLEMMLNSKVKSGNVKISHKKLLEEIGADLAGFKIDG